jgi:hypothetical protein
MGGGGKNIGGPIQPLKWIRCAKADPLDRKIANKIKLIIISFFILNHLP